MCAGRVAGPTQRLRAAGNSAGLFFSTLPSRQEMLSVFLASVLVRPIKKIIINTLETGL